MAVVIAAIAIAQSVVVGRGRDKQGWQVCSEAMVSNR